MFLVPSLSGSGFIPALPLPILPTTYPRTSLEGYGIKSVEIEWRESAFWRAVGAPLLRTVGNSHTTMDLRGPLTATLCVFIATAKRRDA
jgi:hypothetical protein